jgi:prolyl oligopeptidase
MSNKTMSISVLLPTPEHDPYLWLEEVEGEKALAWVREQNKVTRGELEALPNFEPMRERILTILDSEEKIPYIAKYGQWYYNFWQDKTHVRGLRRRTTLEEYRKDNPLWESVLDLDQLAAAENENWVWKGSDHLEPTHDRCLVYLSRGGSDANVIREFDLQGKQFVKDGFSLLESKGYASYRDRDSLYTGRDFGEGSLTTSGYPRLVKEWRRGTPLEDAQTLYEGEVTDMGAGGGQLRTRGLNYDAITRRKSFYTQDTFFRQQDNLIKLEIPDDAEMQMIGAWLALSLKSPYKVSDKTYPTGALVLIRLADFLQGSRDFATLFEPAERKVLESYIETKNFIVLNVLDNLERKLYALKFEDGQWQQTALESPLKGGLTLWAEDDESSDNFFLEGSDYLTPSSFYFANANGTFERLKQAPAWYDSSQYIAEKFEATSKDGVSIPYFVVRRKDIKFDGKNPTLLYGYGGFEISLGPAYKAVAWLENGGVYVEAMLRGGGEFGPDWHWAATKANKQRTFDDFIAIAEDIIAKGITSPQHLGIMGGSNGGLLMGAMLTQRPELFGAIVCAVPLLDMYRYSQMLAGASWMAEYGDPSKSEEWAYIQKYSPYHGVKAEMKYPPVLFTTSTKDDRVHPGHARKMTALLKELGYDVLLYENIEGGHAGAANNAQTAYRQALSYSFLFKKLA